MRIDNEIGRSSWVKSESSWPNAVLEDREVTLGEVRDVTVAAVDHRQVEIDELDAHLEGGPARGRGRRLGKRTRHRHERQGGDECQDPHERFPVGLASRTFTPGRATVSSSLRSFPLGSVA